MDAQIGTKPSRSSARAAAVPRRTRPPGASGGACLSGEARAALGALVAGVERHAGFPQDVEWALAADGRLHLLQSRPVTNAAALDAPGVGGALPEPDHAADGAFTTPGFHESLAHSLELMGLPPFPGEWFTRLDG